MTVVVRSHEPIRPLWLCRACAAPWPCGAARLALRAQYAGDQPSLLVYLATVFAEATGHLVGFDPAAAPAPEAIFARFVGWARVRQPDHPRRA